MTQDDEKWIFKRFQEIYSDCPKGEVHYVDKPDILVQTNTRKIGIEITEICRGERQSRKGSKEKSLAAYRNKIANQVLDVVNPLFPNVNFWIHIHFKDSPIRKERTNAIINIVIELILEKLENFEPRSKYEIFRIDEYKKIASEIYGITIVYHPKHKYKYAYGAAAGMIGNPTIESVKHIIDKKNRLLDQYQNCDEYWLLIAEGLSPECLFDQIPKWNFKDYNCRFTKIFILRLLNEDLIELK